MNLKIGGHTYKVIYKELDNILGETNFNKGEIYIEKNMPQSLKESTLLHEIFHCMNSTFDDTPTGHMLLDSLSEQFYQVLKDNQMLCNDFIDETS